MRFRPGRVMQSGIMIGLFAAMTGILPGSSFSDRRSWAPGEEDEVTGPTSAALTKAKRTLQEMGMKLGDNLGRVGDSGDAKFAFAAEISDPQRALDKGFGLADPRPTPLQSGTSLSIVMDADGRITFFVDSSNRLLDSRNQSTSIALNKRSVPSEVAVSTNAFPSLVK